MGKNDFLTPKAIGNRIKSKGMQKLRWFCQMCQKQCRDENGFKCHLTSETHKRQMELFGQNPHRVVAGFSEEFEKAFMDNLRISHPFSRVSANAVYNEFIRDRTHVHMNSTKWVTLSEFVKYLGREGKCKVEDTDKGWYITLLGKDPFEELGDKKRVKRERAEREEEDRHQKLLEEQIARAQKTARIEEEEEAAVVGEPGGLDKPLGFSLGGGGRAAAREAPVLPAVPAFRDDGDGGGKPPRPPQAGAAAGPHHKKSKLEELMERELKAKQHHLHGAPPSTAAAPSGQLPPGRSSGPWLLPGIIVKVMSKALREHGYYKAKGLVLRVLDTYIAEIEVLGSRDVVRVDQEELETVIPQPGGRVVIVGAGQRGKRGTLLGIDEDKYRAEVEVEGGGREWLEYEAISKLG